ncbi:MAG: M48 family metallopeptidase, partial [Thermoleophilia bacterium]
MTTRGDTLTIDDLTFSLRRSARRRTIAISVGHDGSLGVAAPVRCSSRRIEEAVRARLPWVRRKLAELPPPRQYATGERLPFLGRDCELVVVGPDARPPVALRGDVLYLREEATSEDRRRRLGAWYTRQARRRLTARVARFAPLVGAEPTRITVRDMRSRWGSCTARGRVSFSWAIVALPPAIADYVVVH